MKTHRVIVTGGGTATALTVLKAFRLQNHLKVEVILADPSPTIAGRHLADGYLPLPIARDPDFVDRLLEGATALGACMVVPIFDLEFPTLAAARGRFAERGIRLAISSPEAISTCRDKLKTADFFKANEVPTPETWAPEEALALPDSAYPLLVKPRDGRGSIDVFRVEDRAALQRALAVVDFALVQRCVEGEGVEEVTIDTLCDASGRFVAACPRIRQVIKAGQSYKGLTFEDPEAVRHVKRLCEALPIEGPACIQYFRTPDGPLFFEINPRFGAASILSIRAGLQGPLYMLREALGMTAPAIQVRSGVQMLRFWEEVFVDTATDTALDREPLARKPA